MIKLNIPDQNFQVIKINSKTYIFDFLRKTKLILTPEIYFHILIFIGLVVLSFMIKKKYF